MARRGVSLGAAAMGESAATGEVKGNGGVAVGVPVDTSKVRFAFGVDMTCSTPLDATLLVGVAMAG